MLKMADLLNKTVVELGAQLKQLQNDYFQLKMLAALGRLEKTHQLKENRKEIARVLTVINQKKVADA